MSTDELLEQLFIVPVLGSSLEREVPVVGLLCFDLPAEVHVSLRLVILALPVLADPLSVVRIEPCHGVVLVLQRGNLLLCIDHLVLDLLQFEEELVGVLCHCCHVVIVPEYVAFH